MHVPEDNEVYPTQRNAPFRLKSKTPDEWRREEKLGSAVVAISAPRANLNKSCPNMHVVARVLE
jgi:hypothetical protein